MRLNEVSVVADDMHLHVNPLLHALGIAPCSSIPCAAGVQAHGRSLRLPHACSSLLPAPATGALEKGRRFPRRRAPASVSRSAWQVETHRGEYDPIIYMVSWFVLLLSSVVLLNAFVTKSL